MGTVKDDNYRSYISVIYNCMTPSTQNIGYISLTTNTINLSKLFIGSLLISFEKNKDDSMCIDETIIQYDTALLNTGLLEMSKDVAKDGNS